MHRQKAAGLAILVYAPVAPCPSDGVHGGCSTPAARPSALPAEPGRWRHVCFWPPASAASTFSRRRWSACVMNKKGVRNIGIIRWLCFNTVSQARGVCRRLIMKAAGGHWDAMQQSRSSHRLHQCEKGICILPLHRQADSTIAAITGFRHLRYGSCQKLCCTSTWCSSHAPRSGSDMCFASPPSTGCASSTPCDSASWDMTSSYVSVQRNLLLYMPHRSQQMERWTPTIGWLSARIVHLPKRTQHLQVR